MTTEDPGLDHRPPDRSLPSPPPPELGALQDRLNRAISLVEDLASEHAAAILARRRVEARGRQWADIAYQAWELLADAWHDGAKSKLSPIEWVDARTRLGAKLRDLINEPAAYPGCTCQPPHGPPIAPDPTCRASEHRGSYQ